MKIQRFSLTCFVALALACLAPLLSAEEGKKVDDKKKAAKPSGAFFHVAETKLGFKDIVKAWNAAHKDKVIKDDVKVTDKSVVIKDYYAPKGAKLDAAEFVKCYSDATKLDDIKKGFETMFVKDEDYENNAETISTYFGYKDSVAIGFPKDNKEVEPVLKQNLERKIYGLEEVKADEAGFTEAIKAVYGDNDIVFDKVPITAKSNLENLKTYLGGIKTEKIGDDEKDAKLVAIREAVKAHNEKKTKETLEEVKKAWLHQLKGDASAGGNASSGLPGWAWVLIIVVVVVALAAGGYGAYRFMQKGDSK